MKQTVVTIVCDDCKQVVNNQALYMSVSGFDFCIYCLTLRISNSIRKFPLGSTKCKVCDGKSKECYSCYGNGRIDQLG